MASMQRAQTSDFSNLVDGDDSAIVTETGGSPDLQPQGNAAAQSALPGGGGGAGGNPDGGGSGLPFQGDMEAAFGADFSGVSVDFGDQSALNEMNATAAASGEHVSFRDANPDKETVGHELAHVMQFRNGGGGGAPMAKSIDGGDQDPAEKEADAAGAKAARGEQVSVTGTPTAEVHRENENMCVEPDAYAKTYALMDNDASIANKWVDTYEKMALANVNTLQNAYMEASKAVERNSKLKDAKSFWDGFGVAVLMAAISLIPAVGPIASHIKRVAGEGFWAEGMKAGINLVTSTIANFGVNYKGPDKPGFGKPDSLPKLIETSNQVIKQETVIWRDMYTNWRNAWQTNNQASEPKPWGASRLQKIASSTFSNVTAFTMAPLTKAFEEVLWNDYLKENCHSTYNNYVFKDATYGFKGLSKATIDYLTKRFGWSAGTIAGKCSRMPENWAGGTSNGDVEVKP
ncbi:MAG: DUF4157 domain-containing protein [Alphaproteobacteria bacterium]|nr:DUF4157 domain-containing protein [Alphaproteobacteria bacterium]